MPDLNSDIKPVKSNNYESQSEKEVEREHEIVKGGEGVDVDLVGIIERLKQNGNGQQRMAAKLYTKSGNATALAFSKEMMKKVIEDVSKTAARQADAAQAKQTDVNVSPSGLQTKKLPGGTQPGSDIHI